MLVQEYRILQKYKEVGRGWVYLFIVFFLGFFGSFVYYFFCFLSGRLEKGKCWVFVFFFKKMFRKVNCFIFVENFFRNFVVIVGCKYGKLQLLIKVGVGFWFFRLNCKFFGILVVILVEVMLIKWIGWESLEDFVLGRVGLGYFGEQFIVWEVIQIFLIFLIEGRNNIIYNIWKM